MSEENTENSPLSVSDAAARLNAPVDSQEAAPADDEVAVEESTATLAEDMNLNPGQEVASEEDKPEEEQEEESAEGEEESTEEKSSEDEEEPQDTAEDGEEGESEDAPEPTYTTKGGEVVTLDELKKGYLRVEDYTQKSQANAEAAKEIANHSEQLNQSRLETAEYLEYALNAIDPVFARGAQTDWDSLLNSDPHEHATQWAEYQQSQLKMQNLQGIAKQLVDQNQAQTDAKLLQYKRTQAQQLLQAFPDMTDGKYRESFGKGFNEYAKSVGFSDAELGQFTDSRLVIAMDKARQFDTSMAEGKKIAKKKISKSSKRSLKPGKPSTKAEKSSAAKKAGRAKLAASGSMKDAAALLGNL